MKKNLSLVHIEEIWSVLCSNAIVDQNSHNVTLSNVLERVNITKASLPSGLKESDKIFLPMPFQVVVLLRKIGQAEFIGDIRSEIVDPTGEILAYNENAMAFQAEKDRMRIIMNYQGIPIGKAGYYDVRILLRPKEGQYEKISEIPLEVKFT